MGGRGDEGAGRTWRLAWPNLFVCEFVFIFGQRPQRGQYPVEYRGNVCIFLSIYLFVCPQPANSCRSLDGWTDRQTNWLTDICIDFPCVMFYKTLPPLGPLPCLFQNCRMFMARVPVTIYCLRAMVLFPPLPPERNAVFFRFCVLGGPIFFSIILILRFFCTSRSVPSNLFLFIIILSFLCTFLPFV